MPTRKPLVSATTRRRILRTGLRVIAPVLAGLAIALQAGVFGGIRKAPDAPAGTGLTPVNAPAPVILGTRG